MPDASAKQTAAGHGYRVVFPPATALRATALRMGEPVRCAG
ncbi:MAG: hypothetical protein ACP5P9_00435 [Acidimicrobiales bacterium]